MRTPILMLLLFLNFLTINAQSTDQSANILQSYRTTSIVNATDLNVLRINLRDSVYSDETVIAFKKGYQAIYQISDSDAPYMPGAALSISSLTSDNKSMAINFMPEMTEVKEIKLCVNSKTTREAEIIFTEVPDGNYRFILKDKFLNTEKIIKKDVRYNLLIDKSDKNSYGTERFSVIIISDNITSVNENIHPVLFPNPAVNTLYIQKEESSSQLIDASIYMISGKLIKTARITTNNLSLDISDLQSGSYLVILKDSQTGRQIAKNKFLKQ